MACMGPRGVTKTIKVSHMTANLDLYTDGSGELRVARRGRTSISLSILTTEMQWPSICPASMSPHKHPHKHEHPLHKFTRMSAHRTLVFKLNTLPLQC